MRVREHHHVFRERIQHGLDPIQAEDGREICHGRENATIARAHKLASRKQQNQAKDVGEKVLAL